MKNLFIPFVLLICCVTSSEAQEKKIRAKLEAGEIIALRENATFADDYVPSKEKYQNDILGVATGIEAPKKKSDMILKEGITTIKVNTENGAIKKGDYITSSSAAGIGMKATDAGMVIGVALEDANVASGTVKIRILVQYVKP